MQECETMKNRSQLLDLCDISTWEVDLFHRKIFVSDTLLDRLGMTDGNSDLKLTHWREYVHPSDTQRIALSFRKLILGKIGNVEHRCRLCNADRDWEWYYIRATNLEHSENNRLSRFGGVLIPISGKYGEENAIAEDLLFRMFMDHFPGFAYIKDYDSKVIFANRPLSAYAGVKPSEIIGKDNFDLLSKEEASELLEEEREILNNGKKSISEKIGLGAKKSNHFYSVRFPIRRHFAPPLLGGFAIDITALREAKAAAERAKAEKESLLRELQHRVKNSFHLITSLIELEMMRTQGEETTRVLLNLEARISSLSQLYSMLSTAEETTSVSLKEYFERVVDSIKNSFLGQSKDHSIKTELDEIQVGIKEATSLGLIVNEWITNSLKYAFPESEGGTVEVGLRNTGDGFRVRVRDNGDGIPDTVDLENPSGLGLQLVQMLSRQLGGEIQYNRKDGYSIFELNIVR